MQHAAIPLLALVVLACNGRPTADHMSDRQAKALIEDWASQPRSVRLGSMTVVRNEEPQWDKGEINLVTFELIEAWAKAGVVSLEVPKDLTQGFTGWNDWMARWGSGIEKKIVVNQTELGRKFETVATPAGLQFLRMPGPTCKVHRIVQNEGVKKGADAYRVLLATYEVMYSPEELAAAAARGTPERSPEKKCRLLLKWDPFKETWNVTGADVVDAGREFSTSDVFESILH